MTDQQLWQQLKSGDKKALERIYRAHVMHLSDYGRRFCSDDMLVQDCLQDLFVYLWQKRETMQVTDAIRPYLLVSFRRRIIRALQSRKGTVTMDDHPLDFIADWSFEEQLIAQDMAEEQRKQLKAGLSELSERQREALFLRYYEGLTYEEIGEVMGLRYQSIRNLVSRAIHKLRSQLPICIGLILWMLNGYK